MSSDRRLYNLGELLSPTDQGQGGEGGGEVEAGVLQEGVGEAGGAGRGAGGGGQRRRVRPHPGVQGPQAGPRPGPGRGPPCTATRLVQRGFVTPAAIWWNHPSHNPIGRTFFSWNS